MEKPKTTRRRPARQAAPVDETTAPVGELQVPVINQRWVSQERNGTHVTITYFGYKMDEVRSALQKACRRGQEEQAAWWAWQMIKHGWVKYMWRTLRTIAVEDVGFGDPMCVVQVDALATNAKELTDNFKKTMNLGMCAMQAIIVICRAKKDWQVTHLLCKMIDETARIDNGEIMPRIVPDEALDAHTDKGRKRGVQKSAWWAEGDNLAPKSAGHHESGNDPYAGVRGSKNCT